jgi:hypothetical protein
MRRLSFILLALCTSVFAATAGNTPECAHKQDIFQNRNGIALVGAQLRLCDKDATGTPCSIPAQMYSERTCTSILAQPISTDVNGTYSFYAVPGTYLLQATFAGATRNYIDYVVPPQDSAPGEWTLPVFKDDGTTAGLVGLIPTSRNLRITAVHVRAAKPWVGCSVAGIVTVAGRSQTNLEADHFFAQVVAQSQIKPSGQGNLSYILNADLIGQSLTVLAGDELKVTWKPASGCSQFADGVQIAINYEGAR